MINFHILTIFKNIFSEYFFEGIIGKAQDKGLINIYTYDLRDYAEDKHKTVDDYIFGGGSMLFKPEPLFNAVENIQKNKILNNNKKCIILLTPQGQQLNHNLAKEIASFKDIIMICGRYEGVDERVRENLVTHEVSIGDYVLTGGELPSMVLIDVVSRLIPGVVGSQDSVSEDSFARGLIEHPQYTRPSMFRNWKVPEVLLSGNHKEILKWRRQESLRKTFYRRPDLLDSVKLSEEDLLFINKLKLKEE
tara:strand:- start:4351 stop:5097 length:747 start_codon:yes stop_codon:yes gene_type:complete